MDKVGTIAHVPGRRSGKTAVVAGHVAAALAAGVHVVNSKGEKVVAVDIDDNLVTEPAIPRRLSIDPNSPDFHPSYVRVGVRVDGEERNNLQWYDADRLEYMTTDKTSHLATSIEPYWRFPESRQQRRARERWEGKRK